eukprot:gene7753-7818_t
MVMGLFRKRPANLAQNPAAPASPAESDKPESAKPESAKPEPAPPESPKDEAPLSPVATMILADMALRAGQALVRRGVERGILQGQPAPKGRVVRGRSLGETVVGTVLNEVARRSVPGAILVGGGLLAKALRDRHRAKTERKRETPD